MKTILCLLALTTVAHAQGVNERMITGAPPAIVVPPSAPSGQSTAVPTGPRPQSYPPIPPYSQQRVRPVYPLRRNR